MNFKKTLCALLCGVTLISFAAEETIKIDKSKIAITPVSGQNETNWRKFWWPRYEAKLKQVKEQGDKVEIVFLGDSITNFWETKGKKVFDEQFADYGVLNLGFSGDRTQQMLWLIKDGDIFNQIKPKLIVMMIGTNNLGWNESGAKETLEAIKYSLELLRKDSPEAKILLFGVFPRGKDSSDKHRPEINAINAKLPEFADNKNIFFVDITNQLMNEDGSIDPKIMPDFLHPEHDGYVIWAEAIMPYVYKYVGKK